MSDQAQSTAGVPDQSSTQSAAASDAPGFTAKGQDHPFTLQWENASTKDGKRFMTGTEKRQAEIGDAVATGVGLPAAPLHPGKPAFRPLKTKEINVDWPVWSGEIVSASLDWVTTSHEVVSATGIKEYSLMQRPGPSYNHELRFYSTKGFTTFVFQDEAGNLWRKEIWRDNKYYGIRYDSLKPTIVRIALYVAKGVEELPPDF